MVNRSSESLRNCYKKVLDFVDMVEYKLNDGIVESAIDFFGEANNVVNFKAQRFPTIMKNGYNQNSTGRS